MPARPVSRVNAAAENALSSGVRPAPGPKLALWRTSERPTGRLTASEAAGVVVLGMGRSGTSAVAGMFTSAGFFAGHDDDVLPATPSNARGHHENLGVLQTNERVLEELAGRWYNAPPRAAQLAAADRIVPLLRGEIERMLRDADGLPIVVKDPRIGCMLPLWEPIIAEYLHPVLVIRNPIEISRSLCRRDRTPLPYGLAIWELHMTALLQHLDGRTVTVAPYAHLLEDGAIAERIVTLAAESIDPGRARHVRSRHAFRALDHALHHNVARPGDDRELLTRRQDELWRLLGSLRPGNQRIDVPEHLSVVSEHSREVVLEEMRRAQAEEDRSRLGREISEQHARCATLEAELIEAQDALSRGAAREAQLHAETHRFADELHELESRYAVVVGSRRWRAMGPPARAVDAARRMARR